MIDKNSLSGTLIVAVGLCLVASILVSTAAVSRRPAQVRNKALDKKKNILLAAGLYKDMESIDDVYAKFVRPKLVELASGNYVTDIDVEKFDERKASKDPAQAHVIPDGKDITGIKQHSKLYVAYEIVDANGTYEQVVLPIHGKGLWSTLYGFIALGTDSNTVKGLGFYEHAETAGLGGEIDNPRWKAIWPGKKIYGEDGSMQIRVIKGSVNTSSPDAVHQIDGISGATITVRGVSNLVRYWLSDEGFGKYLVKLKTQHQAGG